MEASGSVSPVYDYSGEGDANPPPTAAVEQHIFSEPASQREQGPSTPVPFERSQLAQPASSLVLASHAPAFTSPPRTARKQSKPTGKRKHSTEKAIPGNKRLKTTNPAKKQKSASHDSKQTLLAGFSQCTPPTKRPRMLLSLESCDGADVDA